MPKEDFDAGRTAGVFEGRRLASEARRWTDLLILIVIVASALLVVRGQGIQDRKLISHVNHNSFVGCTVRNRILMRQVEMYRQEADLVRVDAQVSAAFRERWIEIKDSAANDIERIGVQDCGAYLRDK